MPMTQFFRQGALEEMQYIEKGGVRSNGLTL